MVLKNSSVIIKNPNKPPQTMGATKASAVMVLIKPTIDMSLGVFGFELLSINSRSQYSPTMTKVIIMPEQSANIIHLPVTVNCNPMNQLIMRSKPFNPESSLQFSDKNKPKPDDVDCSRLHCNIESKLPEITSPETTPESTRTPGPEGAWNRCIGPGAGRKFLPGSSPLILNSNEWPEIFGSG